MRKNIRIAKELVRIARELVAGRKSTREEFIDKARHQHGDEYDYSKVDYKGSYEKVCIKCNKCGREFWQKPVNHLRGNGCPHCGGRIPKSNTEEFIQKAKEVHGDRYDYSKVEYQNVRTPVCIKCNKCGKEFWQIPDHHLRNHGCPYCNGTRHPKSTKEEFIDKANKKHNYSYDYSKVEYVNSDTKVEIICPKHGPFMQKPDSHLQGQGCPECAIERRTYGKNLPPISRYYDDNRAWGYGRR